MSVGVARMIEACWDMELPWWAPRADARAMECAAWVPMAGVELPLGGRRGWPAASHRVVVNKSRLPQPFRFYGVFSHSGNRN